MKREIKFRAWDNERKQMANYVPILILCKSSIWPHDLGYFHNSQQWTPDEGLITDYELMQFTGLYDKNGKEIYEGDILKLQYPINYGFGGVYNQEIIVTILFESGCFWFSGDGYTDCNWHFYNEYEVIGNIYEHSNLLDNGEQQK